MSSPIFLTLTSFSSALTTSSIQNSIAGSALWAAPTFANPEIISTVLEPEAVVEKIRTRLVKKLKVDETSIEPLCEIYKRVLTEENEEIKKSLNKSRGYLARLFSNESWDEWLESRTELGKAIDSLDDGCKRLSKERVEKASKEAQPVLKRLVVQKKMSE